MRRARFAKYPNRAKVPRVVRTPTTLATYFIWCQKRSLAMTASLTVLADRLRSVDADTPAYPSRMRARRKSYEKGAGPGACAHAAGTSACLPEGLHSRGGHVMVSAVTATLTWTLLGASLIVGLAALVRMADPAALSAHEITGVVRLAEGLTRTVVALFVLAAIVFLVDLVRRLR